MTLKVGLTGGIGSGKSFVSECFASLGVPIVDADIISREAVRPNSEALQAIGAHFGPAILLESGELNRQKLRNIIFNNDDEKHWLENLLHPLIRHHIIEKLAQSQAAYTILVSPLLFETEQNLLTDVEIVVDVPEQTQVERASLRDSMTALDIQKVMNSQLLRAERMRRAQHVIDNSGSKEATIQHVNRLHHQLMDRAVQTNQQTD